jgi:FemAB-related protein (PEP-CTERM system-associated)
MDLVIHQHRDWRARLPEWELFLAPRATLALSRHPAWLGVLEAGLDQEPYLLEARRGPTAVGFLPLAHVRSVLFGRFLVSLPYLNSGGVLADEPQAAHALMDRAILLANDLEVRHLELRHETAFEHSQLTDGMTNKVHMRRALPVGPAELWDQLSSKVRNQVRKGRKAGLSLAWGHGELLDDFYAVFSRNMRDLGTPVYSHRFFACIMKTFAAQAELCVLRLRGQPVAAALLLHGRGVTEVPSASSLREFNASCANMLLYWHLLERAVDRGQQVFDFGRSTLNGSTYQFKKQWGALPQAAAWQYHYRAGKPGEMRPENPRFQRLSQLWRRLPVPVANFLGPRIVRGIP